MVVQSVLFNKHKWSIEKASNWLIEHGYKVKKVDETKNFYRFRQRNPQFRGYYNHKLDNGIELVIGI